jgi:hypothetical protein
MRSNPSFTWSLRAAVILAMAVTLGACSRSQNVSEAVSGPVRVGSGESVVAGCPTLLQNTPATASEFQAAVGSVPSLTSKRLRIETPGDILDLPSIDQMGPCMSTGTASMFVIGGHANVFISGTTTSISGPMTFGALPSGAPIGEQGVVVGQDALGNVLEIIWPALAGTGVGAPIVRIQLAQWNRNIVTTSTKLDIQWDMVFAQDAVTHYVTGKAAGIPTNGTAVILNAPAPPPCPATLGGGGVVINQFASVPRWTAKALRAEIVGDVALGTINAVGPCAASATPSVSFTGGTGSMKLSGTNTSVAQSATLTFGPLLFPGIALEPGVVVASDNNKNILEIVWPGLAGLAPGPPILRFQLARWTSAAQPGRSVDIALRYNAVGADGVPASFTASANGLLLPAIK